MGTTVKHPVRARPG